MYDNPTAEAKKRIKALLVELNTVDDIGMANSIYAVLELAQELPEELARTLHVPVEEVLSKLPRNPRSQ